MRRDPKQGRSRALVDAILEAIGRIVSTGDRLTTKRVAEAAGVSVGSLYDYFPSKESMVENWARAAIRESLKEFDRDIEAFAERPLREALTNFVNRMIATRTDSSALRTIVKVFARFEPERMTRALDAEVLPLMAKFLRYHASETRPLDPELSAFLILHATRWITIAASYVPGLLQSTQFRDELVHLLFAYVRVET